MLGVIGFMRPLEVHVSRYEESSARKLSKITIRSASLFHQSKMGLKSQLSDRLYTVIKMCDMKLYSTVLSKADFSK